MSINEQPALKTILKAHKVRLFPTNAKIKKIEENFNCSRFVKNWFVNINKERLDLGEYKLNYNVESSILTLLKVQNDWLKNADKFALQNALKDQDNAYGKLFKKQGKFPKFKSKKDSYQSYRTNLTNGNIEIKGKYIKLPKVGYVKFKQSQEINGRILNVTVSRSNDKYYASIAVETLIEPKPMSTRRVGIDLGLKSLLVLKDDLGNVQDINNPKWLERSLKNLKRKHKQLSRKQHSRKKGDTTPKSKSYLKQQKTVSKIQQKVANQRKDFLHKLTTSIIGDNQTIGIEDLAVSNLMKNHKLSRHIAQSGWSMLGTMLEYKAEWNNRNIKVHNRFYASSKLCRCGVKNKELKLSDRIWICKSCGAINQSDELAADNLIPTEHGKFTLNERAMAGSYANA